MCNHSISELIDIKRSDHNDNVISFLFKCSCLVIHRINFSTYVSDSKLVMGSWIDEKINSQGTFKHVKGLGHVQMP